MSANYIFNFCKILCIFISFPIVCAAQVNLSVSVVDAYTGKPLDDVFVWSGIDGNTNSYCGRSRYGLPAKISHLIIQQLDDSLFLSHCNYWFPRRLITEYDYSLDKKTISIKVLGYPIMRDFTVSLPISKSKKVKNDSVSLVVYHKVPNSIITLFSAAGAEICGLQYKESDALYHCRLPLDALQDGYFILKNKELKDSFAFRKTDWKQRICLEKSENSAGAKKEIELLKTYFSLQQYAAEIQKIAAEKHQREMDSLNKKAQLLQREIDALKNKPISEFKIDKPESDLVYPYDIFKVVESSATPEEGMEVFLKRLQQSLSAEQKTARCGSLSIQISVEHSGNVVCSSLHCPKGMEKLEAEIMALITKSKWIPAKQAGIPVQQELVITFDITAK